LTLDKKSEKSKSRVPNKADGTENSIRLGLTLRLFDLSTLDKKSEKSKSRVPDRADGTENSIRLGGSCLKDSHACLPFAGGATLMPA